MRACQRQIDIKDRQWQTELDRYLGQIELADVDRYLGQIEIADVDRYLGQIELADVDRQSQQMNELDKCVSKILQMDIMMDDTKRERQISRIDSGSQSQINVCKINYIDGYCKGKQILRIDSDSQRQIDIKDIQCQPEIDRYQGQIVVARVR